MLFIRGDALSGPTSISGTIQFPKLPVMIAKTTE